jgi:hypothetical protein
MMNTPSLQDSNVMSKSRIIINWLIYQAVWFACIIGAASGKPWIGIVVGITAIIVHLSLASRPTVEFSLIMLTGLIGGVWDSLLVIIGLIDYPGGMLVKDMAPPWIIMLWMAFATTFNMSLRWLRGHDSLSAVFGLLGGPLAWWAGQGFGALVLVQPIPALAALALGWGLLMPGLIKLSIYIDDRLA